MPFTAAHPAIILPLIRSRYFSATALIMGSMSPDFEYFFLMRVKGEHSHTIWGLLYFDIPVTIALGLVFHLWVKRNLILNLPVFFQRRLQSLLQLDYLTYVKTRQWTVIYSALLGAFAHLFWDSFTHRSSFAVRNLSFYEGTTVPFGGINYPLFYALQYISTYVGLLIILVYVVMMKPADNDRQIAQPGILYWSLLILITLIVVYLRFSVYSQDCNLGNIVVSIISGFCLALIGCGFINFKNTEQQSLNG